MNTYTIDIEINDLENTNNKNYLIEDNLFIVLF